MQIWILTIKQCFLQCHFSQRNTKFQLNERKAIYWFSKRKNKSIREKIWCDTTLEDYMYIKCTYTQMAILFQKELTICIKLWFSNPYIFGFQRRKSLIFQNISFVRSKNISLKYQRFTTLGSKDIGIWKSEFVAKSQFL